METHTKSLKTVFGQFNIMMNLKGRMRMRPFCVWDLLLEFASCVCGYGLNWDLLVSFLSGS